MKDAKLVLRQDQTKNTRIRVGNSVVGSRDLFLVAGPCAVESREQMEKVASALAHGPVQAIRGGAFKPRTSPYSFQGLGIEGLEILSDLSSRFAVPVITEVMTESQIPDVAEHADVLQIGSRNMQNFDLLKAVGSCHRPVILKRGLAATLEEFIMAAEYIMAHGNAQVILCERGIRSFDSFTRNVLDLGAVVALKQMTHLPVIVDPSHAAGKSELIADLAKASVACGADGLMIECHPEPSKSVSDARQALSLEEMLSLIEALRPVAQAVGRNIVNAQARNLVFPVCADQFQPAAELIA